MKTTSTTFLTFFCQVSQNRPVQILPLLVDGQYDGAHERVAVVVLVQVQLGARHRLQPVHHLQRVVPVRVADELLVDLLGVPFRVSSLRSTTRTRLLR